MKRKNLAIIYLFILSIGTILSLYIPKNEVTANDALVIPNDAIRLRILANSDSSKDQEIKRMVRDEVNEEITKWVAELTSKEAAREVIKAGIPEIQQMAEAVMAKEKVNQTVKVEFGVVEFPTKLYGQFLYPAGQYEAILITLGEGTGANWWCVLFPPLCFLDFSNGVAVSEGFDEEEEKIADNEDNTQDEKNTKNQDKKKTAVEAEEQKDSVEQTEAVEAVVEVMEEVVTDSKEVAPAEDSQKEAAAEVEEEEVNPEQPAVDKENKQSQSAPVFTGEDEQPVEVKFFVKEIWDKLFG
ncbi:stage II sporulation protein R [Bacillus tuaregi]|uniref:stage II sporulation protein R n=1 Tax=Bacillus tuaregi TaxID=1816695 RepID=UPI0008F876A9|nr:stage II sporulation protein R [Bacillus tuaregi]